MKRKILAILMIMVMLTGCNNSKQSQNITTEVPVATGEESQGNNPGNGEADGSEENVVFADYDGKKLVDVDTVAVTVGETEIGRVCVQLANPDFKYMTGETLTLEGGLGQRP